MSVKRKMISVILFHRSYFNENFHLILGFKTFKSPLQTSVTLFWLRTEQFMNGVTIHTISLGCWVYVLLLVLVHACVLWRTSYHIWSKWDYMACVLSFLSWALDLHQVGQAFRILYWTWPRRVQVDLTQYPFHIIPLFSPYSYPQVSNILLCCNSIKMFYIN